MKYGGELPAILEANRASIEAFASGPRSISGVFKACNPFVGRRCFFKLPLDKPSIDAEAENIRLASETTAAVKGARPPRIIAVLPEHKLLLTEVVENRGSVFNLLSASSCWWSPQRWSGQDMEAAGQSLGVWLRAYHQGTSAGLRPRAETIDRLSEICLGRLRTIRRSHEGAISSQSARLIEELANEYRESCRSAPVSVSQIHGDLNLSNILVEKGTNQLVVVDFGDAREGISLDDLGTVLHTTVTLLAAGESIDPGAIPFARGLLEGYGLDIEEKSMLGLVQVMCALRTIQSYYEFRKSNRFVGFLTDRAYRKCAMNSVKWLARQRTELLACVSNAGCF